MPYFKSQPYGTLHLHPKVSYTPTVSCGSYEQQLLIDTIEELDEETESDDLKLPPFLFEELADFGSFSKHKQKNITARWQLEKYKSLDLQVYICTHQ